MANAIFNVARGMIGYYATLPGTNDAIIAVPIEAAGLPANDTLVDFTNLSTLLAGAANEQTTMGRKALTNVAPVLNTTTNSKTVDADDIMFTAASGNAIAAVLLCYDPDTTASVDTNIVPLIKLDVAITPIGSNIVLQLNPEGFYKSI